MRLDKWLWAARFFKTRSLAQQAIEAGRIKLNEQRVKPAHALKVADSVCIRIGDSERRIHVKALSERRGPAEEGRKLYEETDASRAEREWRAQLRRWGPEPAAGLKGRPTKRERRRMEELTRKNEFEPQ